MPSIVEKKNAGVAIRYPEEAINQRGQKDIEVAMECVIK